MITTTIAQLPVRRGEATKQARKEPKRLQERIVGQGGNVLRFMATVSHDNLPPASKTKGGAGSFLRQEIVDLLQLLLQRRACIDLSFEG